MLSRNIVGAIKLLFFSKRIYDCIDESHEISGSKNWFFLFLVNVIVLSN